MADPTLAQSPPHLEKLLDSARFPRVAQFIKDPSVENTVRVFYRGHTVGPRSCWSRGVLQTMISTSDGSADWTEEIWRAHASGCSYYIFSTGVSAGADIDSSPSWFSSIHSSVATRPRVSSTAICCNRQPLRLSEQENPCRIAKTGWYDDSRVQSWVFVFGRVAGSTALPDLGDANPPTSPASHPNRAEGRHVHRTAERCRPVRGNKVP